MPELPYWALATVYGKEFGVDPRLAEAVMRQESGGDPHARSPVGAEGLMQLMPGTAEGLGVKNPWDPAQNLHGGIRYLAGLLHSFHGNLAEALAAYNAGPGAVERFGGVPPYKETQEYVRSVEANYRDIGGKVGESETQPSAWDSAEANLDHAVPLLKTIGHHGETTTPFLQSLHKAAASASPWQSTWSLLTTPGGPTAATAKQ